MDAVRNVYISIFPFEMQLAKLQLSEIHLFIQIHCVRMDEVYKYICFTAIRTPVYAW